MSNEFGFMKVKIRDGATFKTKKQIWKLRTAKSYLTGLLKEIKCDPNKDTADVSLCVQIIDRVIENQVGVGI